VPLAKWDFRSRGRGDGHSPEYKELRIAAEAGKVFSFKVGGSNRVYVRESDAVAFLNARAAEPQQPAKAVSIASQPDAAACAIRQLDDTLKRLVAAVEALGKQQEPVGSFRDMNGDVMT